MPEDIGDDLLRGYLAESLGPEDSARVEKALRGSAELRGRLELVRDGRQDAGLHSLGAIWRRGRLSCPPRPTLGSYLLDALEPDHADYVRFHVEDVGCPFCEANLADLRSKADAPPSSASITRRRIYHSSRHLLGGEG